MEENKTIELNEQETEEVVGGKYPYRTTIVNYNGHRCKRYVIESGDTMIRICNNLCRPGSLDQVCAFNGIGNPDWIVAGKAIYIPQYLWK